MALTRSFPVKLVAALALGVAAGGVPGIAAAQAGPVTGHVQAVPWTQRLVILGRAHNAYSRPDARSTVLGALAALRPITGERTVLPVLGDTIGGDGQVWLHVMLPGRPNGHTAWISSRATAQTSTAWRLLIEISRRRVTVFGHGHVVRIFRAVVGKRSTPTPQGRFFVEETVALSGDRVGAPFALALSARSDVLAHFDGGPGQIALHGLGNIGGILGTAASHGCVRLDRRAISWLAAFIGPGVPVTISG